MYQRSANWCTPLNNRPITAEEQAELRAGFEQLRDVLNTSIHGFHHPLNPKSAFDDTPEERLAFFEQMWASPGFMKFTSNYVDILTDPAANAEWCEFIAAQDPRGRATTPTPAERLIPRDHRYGEKRPPYVAGLLRGVQPAARVARRPARHADGAGHRDRHRDDRRPCGSTT